MLRGGESVGVETYSNYGMTLNRLRVIPVKELRGSRLFGPYSMNLYQLEYNFKSNVTGKTKHRSFFYRPEHIENDQLFKAVRNGNEIMVEDELEVPKTKQVDTKQERLEKRVKKSKSRAMYR